MISSLIHVCLQPQYGLQNPRLLSDSGVLWMKAQAAQLRQLYEANLATPVAQLMRHGDLLTVDDNSLPNCSLAFVITFKETNN